MWELACLRWHHPDVTDTPRWLHRRQASSHRSALACGLSWPGNHQHLPRLERHASAWVPALEMLHLDVETLGDDIQRVAFLDLVLHWLLAVGLGHQLARVLHHQGLADLE